MHKPLTHPNFKFKPKEAINENRTYPSNSIKYDSIISSILAQATPIQAQSYRLLLSKSNQKLLKALTAQEKMLKSAQTKGRLQTSKLEQLTQEQINNSHRNKLNQTPKGLLIKTKSLYGVNKQISKSKVNFEKRKTEVDFKQVLSLKPIELLLYPEKTLGKTSEKTDNNESLELFDFGMSNRSNHFRKRNPYNSLSKKRERRSLENKLLFAERQQSLEETKHKIDSLFCTQDESKTQNVNLEDKEDDAFYFSQMKSGILNMIRSQRKRGIDNRRINTVN